MGGGYLALCYRDYLVGRPLRSVCLRGKGVWFGFLVRQTLFTRTGLGLMSILPSAGITSGGLKMQQTLKLEGWLESCHGDASTEEYLIKGSHSMKGGKLAEPVPCQYSGTLMEGRSGAVD